VGRRRPEWRKPDQQDERQCSGQQKRIGPAKRGVAKPRKGARLGLVGRLGMVAARLMLVRDGSPHLLRRAAGIGVDRHRQKALASGRNHVACWHQRLYRQGKRHEHQHELGIYI
jgi:hypothetical protein